MANRGTGTTPLTRAQHHALYLLKLARKSDPNTDDGVMATETFYDQEIAVAFIHWRTARSLVKRGLVTYGHYDPDWGTELRLVDA